MNTRRTMAALGVILLVALTAILVLFAPRLRSDGFWQRFAAPGPLTAAHEFMSTNCAGCHEPVAGVSPEQCIACHANDTSLLQRQPTAFHAYVGTCVECHREHDGPAALRAPMDHDALARIGLRLLASAPEDSEGRLLYSHLFAHGLANEALRAQDTLQTPTARERLLDCYGCHDRQDRHAGQFGRDCSSCHSTSAWTLPEYRHPPPSSTDCAQCHRAPPSHYMGHFEMVSKRVARVEHADVAQCYLCHQTTSWNDIKSVGMYDHH